jgi:ribose 5-phosphate isomerase B
MKIAVASDHRGVEVKNRIIQQIATLGHEAVDLGPARSDSVDYPDYAAKVANAITHHEADRGVLICCSGIGMSIAANRFAGVRAALCHDEFNAEICRRYHDANILCLSADLLGEQLVARIVEKWVKTEFEGGRHAKRLEKLEEHASLPSKK